MAWTPKPNFANRTLYHGDNLEILRGMDSETVQLIATDPPFNKGRDFHATPDSLSAGASFQDRWSWKDDVHNDWIDQLEDDWPKAWSVIQGSRDSWGDDMGAFLCFMAVRILEMRRVLRLDGSMYLHCDPTASHYLKGLMDAIFGKDNFRNEIVWKRVNAPKASDYKFGVVHDTILFYTKTARVTLNPIHIPYSKEYVRRHYGRKDKRGNYQITPLTAQGTREGTSGKPWRGRDVYAKGLHWVVPTALPAGVKRPDGYDGMTTQQKLDWLDSEKLIYFPKKQNGMPRFKRYLSTVKGVRMSGVVTDISGLQGGSTENTGYPTQKPLALYERIIKASSNEGDVVLDPFAGCATTCVAAEKLKRQWVGIDIWDGAHGVTISRLKKEGILAGPNGTRPDLIGHKGHITYATEPPRRTDSGEHAVPFLKTVKRVHEPPGPKMTRVRMYEFLLEQSGPICRGCDRTFDDKRYLELDHNTPRADGGINHISNRILLCGPCNKLKGHTLTLSGLRRENKKLGHMQSKPTARIDSTAKQKRLFD